MARTIPYILGVCLLAFASQCEAAILVAQYDFQSAATVGVDSSGNNNDLTLLLGTPVWSASGPTAGANSVVLTSSSSLQRTAGLNNYSGVNGFTYTAWVNLTDASTGYNGIVSQDFGGCCVNRLMVTSSLNPFVNVGQHNDQTLGGTVPDYGNWFFLAMTGQTSGSTTIVHVYVNGTDTTGSPLTEGYNVPDLSTASTYLGTGESGNVWFMNGSLADVRIYDGALTGGEIAAMYESGAAASSVPEPASGALIGTGFFAAALLLRRLRP
jgi:hypothetical protein